MDIKNIMNLLYSNAELVWINHNPPGTNLENCIIITYDEREFLISKKDKEILDEVLKRLGSNA